MRGLRTASAPVCRHSCPSTTSPTPITWNRSGTAPSGARCAQVCGLASKVRAAISWSGGKDSCAALGRVRERFDVVAMVTMFDEAGCRSRSHGLRPEVVAAQARRLGLRQVTRGCDWTTYDERFEDALGELKAGGVTHVVFGDILFED